MYGVSGKRLDAISFYSDSNKNLWVNGILTEWFIIETDNTRHDTFASRLLVVF